MDELFQHNGSCVPVLSAIAGEKLKGNTPMGLGLYTVRF